MARNIPNESKVAVEISMGQVMALISEHNVKKFGAARQFLETSIWFEIDEMRFQINVSAPSQAEMQRIWRGKLNALRDALNAYNRNVAPELAFYEFLVMPNGAFFKDFAKDLIKREYAQNGPPKLTFGGAT